jgi:hypothetical protein
MKKAGGRAGSRGNAADLGGRRTGYVLFLAVAASAARGRSQVTFTCVCQVMPVLHLMKAAPGVSKILLSIVYLWTGRGSEINNGASTIAVRPFRT